MLNKTALAVAARIAGSVCFFAGVFFVSQAYTMAFLGAYLDCFRSEGCAMRIYGEPTLTAWMYGTLLALCAMGTFYAGVKAFRSQRA
jgi:hypothetical protein